MSNVNDVFVYDTTEDSDGAANGEMTKEPRPVSWYNEALDDGSSDPCSNTNDDRCGRREFLEKAILVATTTDVYIFDAKDNSMWMGLQRSSSGSDIGRDEGSKSSLCSEWEEFILQ